MPFSSRVGFFGIGESIDVPEWPTDPSWTQIANEMSNWVATSPPSGNTNDYGLTWTGANPYRDGVSHPNGNVYFIPRDATSVIEFDPVGNVATNQTFTRNWTANNNSYAGGVLADDGIIYCIPYNESHVLKLDPTTYTSSEITLGYVPKLASGIKASNGKIYCVPGDTINGANVLIIDPDANTATVSNMQINGGVQEFGTKYQGATRGPDNRLYFAPADTLDICVIDPTNDTLVETDYGYTITGSTLRYMGAATASNGKIIFAPFNAGKVMVLDTQSNTLSQPFTIAGAKSQGAVTGSDGNVHCIPWTTSTYIRYNPTDDSATTIDAGIGSFQAIGGVIDKNGNLVYASEDDDNENIAVIDLFGSGWSDAETANSAFLSPWINKGAT